ncbi:hypothetical protein RRG08_058451, partial [Elysia crispata]
MKASFFICLVYVLFFVIGEFGTAADVQECQNAVYQCMVSYRRATHELEVDDHEILSQSTGPEPTEEAVKPTSEAPDIAKCQNAVYQCMVSYRRAT